MISTKLPQQLQYSIQEYTEKFQSTNQIHREYY